MKTSGICLREKLLLFVFSYFLETHWKVGNISKTEKDLIQKYEDFSKQLTKSDLLKKDCNAAPKSIRYVARLLHAPVKLPSLKSLNKDHDQEISKNFWYY